MRYRVHYLAWLGLALSLAWVVFIIPELFQYINPGYSMRIIPPPHPVLFWLHVWLYFCFILQQAALILLPAFPDKSKQVALFASAFGLPGSLLYLYGVRKSLKGHA